MKILPISNILLREEFFINELLNNVPGFKRIFSVPQFFGELKKLFGKSKRELEDYKEYLLVNLQILEHTDFHLSDPPFERLVDSRAELYRIKSPSKRKNVRVLYYYRMDDNIVLLYAFEEKSKSDYQRGIETALDRIKWLERSINHEHTRR